ncbi:MAG: hypothetical protein K2N41_01390 [Lachnospiraceae bacterium]|nr:hypothetical protein [Lachnospiraceae bacterium]MDE7238349.1 hypothetical protein [Lachnospiraceae bacterium]
MKKNKLKMYGIFFSLAAVILLLFCLGMICTRRISWEGDFFVDEYTYGESGEGSYRRQVIELHIEEAEELHIRLEARIYFGQEAGLDVTVWNIISNEAKVPKQSKNTQISFSMPAFPDMEEIIYVVLERDGKDGVRIKYSFQETELEEIPFMQAERR